MAAVPSLSHASLPTGLDVDLVTADRLTVDGDVVHWREASHMTAAHLDALFADFEQRTRGWRHLGWVWDLSLTEMPAPSVLLHFRRRAEPLVDRVRHFAICTGVNIGHWRSLRYLLPETGFRSISVHRTARTAIERARHA